MARSLIEQIDDLAAVARAIPDDEVLNAVVTAWREILSSVTLPGEMPAYVADAIERRVTPPDVAGPITPDIERRHREDMRKRGLESDAAYAPSLPVRLKPKRRSMPKPWRPRDISGSSRSPSG